MKELGLINLRDVSEKEVATFSLREAARAVVLDENNLIGLLHVTRDKYYKLPGGGLEGDEEKIIALQRECQEEIGCKVEVLHELGSTTEYWKEDSEKQISYCYLAKIIGAKGIPELTESEKERGFETVWLSYTDALRKLKECNPIHWEGEYIVPREILFLEEAGNYIKE
jgi:8-oxo-dGTP pyrophosphatase MutT (NUDIX family)